MQQEQVQKKWSQIISKAWSDPEFKARLKENPIQTLKAEGIELPQNLQVQVEENTDQKITLVIPQPPEELSDDDLGAVAAGLWWSDSEPNNFKLPT
jgi:hypothetical protein